MQWIVVCYNIHDTVGGTEAGKPGKIPGHRKGKNPLSGLVKLA